MSNDRSKSSSRQKTKFEPVQKRDQQPTQPATPAPPPEQRVQPVQSRAVPPPPAPLPTLRALEPGKAPLYAGLHRDKRGIVVGDQAIVIVGGARRLSALLAALSHIANLASGVRVEALADAAALVALAPQENGTALSQFYDTIQGALAAARLSVTRARLYVGDGRIFVPYADPTAPHGYDVQGTPPAEGRVVLAPTGGQTLPRPQERPLLDALVAVPLQPAANSQPPTLAVLTDRRLAALVANYVQHHGLAYAVRFLTWRQGDGAARQAALFDIVTAAKVQPIPSFVADFLRRLPHTTLLVDALDTADLESEPPRRILVMWGRRTPLYLPHIQDLIPPDGILVMCEPPWGAAMIASPPSRQPMQRLTEVAPAEPSRVSASDQNVGRLRLKLALLHGGPARGPVHGLLLDQAAIGRLRHIVRRLPAPLFAHVRIAHGDGIAVLVADETREIDGLPLGLPLARAEPPELLLPRGMRLLPSLPQDLLVPTLGLLPDTLTVFTPTCRCDVPLAALRPLVSLLALDAPAQQVRIAVQPASLPPLDLSDLEDAPLTTAPTAQEAAPAPAPTSPAPARERRNILERLLSQPLSTGAPGRPFDDELRTRATELEQRGEYELAAAFYTYLKDEKRAAACYQRLAQQEQ